MADRSVTVVIPTYNRLDLLPNVIESYCTQPECLEIIVIDDGSVPRPSAWKDAKTLCSRHDISVTLLRHESRRGASAARNTGIAHARGRFVLTTDDDIRLEHGYMKYCLDVLKAQPKAGFVGGRVIYLHNDETDAAARRRVLTQRHRYYDLKTLTVCFWGYCDGPTQVPFCSAVGIWDRQVFDKGLRYDDGYLGNGYREETDAQVQIQSLGYSVFYQPDAVAYHLSPVKVNADGCGQHRGGRLWYEYWVVRNNLRFLRKHGRTLRREWNVNPRAVAIWFQWLRIRQGATKILQRILRAKS